MIHQAHQDQRTQRKLKRNVMSENLLEVQGLGKHYPIRRLFKKSATVRALDGVSFRVQRGKTLAVVGESGCGKSTLAKLLMRIEDATFGAVSLSGVEMSAVDPRKYRQRVQMVFQDPYSSLNPRKKARTIIGEPLLVNTDLSREERDERVMAMMAKVGLRPEMSDRYPHMFSGGQRQRIGIARALMLRPDLLICDEPVSALDISIQAQVLNLLMDLQDEFKLSYLFISHDLGVVRHIADDVLVMYLGKVMEYGPREAIFNNPQHPYTKMLLASTPDVAKGVARFAKAAEGLVMDSEEASKPVGELPSPMNPPPGCPFQGRCAFAMEKCSQEMPAARTVENRQVACHLY